MKEVFKRATTVMICLSILAFIIGLIMTVYPGLSINTIGIIVGIYIIIHGITLVALDFKSNLSYVQFDGIASGILFILLGIVFIITPGILSIFLTIALGIWIILLSVSAIRLSLVVRSKDSNWILILLFGIIDLIAGIIILFNPLASVISITILSGIVIMFHSIVNIIDMVVIKKNIKNITKEIENSMKRNQA